MLIWKLSNFHAPGHPMKPLLAFLISSCLLSSAFAEIAGAESFTYKTAGDVKLELFVFNPADLKPGEKRPAILLFHGGGWRNGGPYAMAPQCRYFAGRGMVAIAVQYRLVPQVTIEGCIRDAVSAVRWVRSNAGRLGIDPNRIAVGGGSAGGHLAAATGILEGFDEPGEDAKTSARPDAMVLFNPALVLAPVEGFHFELAGGSERWTELKKILGPTPEKISPYHHVRAGLPPALIMHGTADTTVPFSTSELFCAAMKKQGNRCDLVPYPDRSHAFFNLANSKEDFASTLEDCDKFFVSLGWLPPHPVGQSTESQR